MGANFNKLLPTPHLHLLFSTHSFFIPFSYHYLHFLTRAKEGEERGKRKSIESHYHHHLHHIHLGSSSCSQHSHLSWGDIEGIGATKSKGGEVEDLEELELEAPIGEIEG